MQLDEIIKTKYDDLRLIKRLDIPDIGISQRNRKLALSKRKSLFSIVESLKKEIGFVSLNQPKEKVYIPILRSIKTSSLIDSKVFEETTRELYGLDKENVFTGLDLFEKILKIRNDEKRIRKNFEKFENFLSRHFFEKKALEIISHIGEKNIRFLVDGEERKIHDIGDGIQSIISLLFPIFTALPNTWFFIEEPETHLHPGLQRIFIETLINDDFLKGKNLRYFFTTHSNHFLDLTLEMEKISIFQFEKKSVEKYEVKTNVKPNKTILDVLGVNTSSVFLSNTSLWVEGPTDRKYVAKWLRLYNKLEGKKLLKEDIDFAFFEYGGNLIAHYLFDKNGEEINYEKVPEHIKAFSLSNKILLLADSDLAKGSSKKGKRRKILEELSSEKDNFKYLNTIVVEIENLLPMEVIKGFSHLLVKEVHHDKLEGIEFSKEDYSNERLGFFYKKMFKNVKIPEKDQKAFLAKSGTLKNDYKLKLCNYFLEYQIEYEQLVKENNTLKEIIEGLYNFIEA
ncbi:AAA ATPase-like protein [Flagellimonas meridianipacifica]|uniref:AAA ATPase-like protein n=2 Tax=Flagellimonas meridianipacifica TaxID=1080225 RepID=A0A2T0MGV5_9FLAO|nr:AAA family ATPase [Allomuricauda pacifica]PRX56792.1 AAA ATPase-like protein [Allomuricauda pacifica]